MNEIDDVKRNLIEEEKKANEKHRQRHIVLHEMLDELVADWITCENKVPSKSSILELMQWSAKQTKEK